MPSARQSSRTLSRSSCSSSSSAKPVWKNDVGGNCLGSPTTIAALPRASEPTASAVDICDASSKMTVSNRFACAGRYCATVEGLMSMHGHATSMSAGTSVNSPRSPTPRRPVLERRVNAAASTESGPSSSCEGRRASSLARIYSLERRAYSSVPMRNFSMVSSSVPTVVRERSGSAGMLISRKFLYTFFSNPASTFSLFNLPLSSASERKVSPSAARSLVVLRYMHQLGSMSILSMSAPAFEE